jgi:C4-dicarboxylate-specific signal transduction histidine kinase
VATDGAYGLELAACQSLVRRLGGSLRAEAMPGGEAVVVELPAAPGA